MSRDLVVFGEDWGRHPSSTQHLVKHLAEGRKVLYVNSIGLRRPRLDAADLRRAGSKLLAGLGRGGKLRDRPPGLSVLSPLALPWPASRLAGRLNACLVGGTVRRAMRRCAIERPVLWIALPSAAVLAGRLGEHALVYYCGDDFGALAGVDHTPVLELERSLAGRADRILAASAALAAKFPAAKTALLPHGVDFELFADAAARPPDLPGGPVAGFYGSIAEWLDQELLAGAARLLPSWRFVLIGEVRAPVEQLERLPNVQFLGRRPHDALPGYVQHWDVTLLPFVDNAQIRASNPLKLREYMAAGRPIVSTPLPALEPFREFVAVADDAAGLARAILAAAAEPPAMRERRRRKVAGESWAERAREVAVLLDSL